MSGIAELRKAKEILETQGWVQHTPGTSAGFCAGGAIVYAVTGKADWVMDNLTPEKFMETLWPASVALAGVIDPFKEFDRPNVLRLQRPDFRTTTPEEERTYHAEKRTALLPMLTIIDFNDARERTKEEVLAKFEEAIHDEV